MRRGRLGHMILLHLVDRRLRGIIGSRKTRRDAALPSADAGGYAQSLCHIPTPVSFWPYLGRSIRETGLPSARRPRDDLLGPCLAWPECPWPADGACGGPWARHTHAVWIAPSA